MLREMRHLRDEELGARFDALELRTPTVRASVHRCERGASDYGLVQRAAGFAGVMVRPAVTLLLRGEGRVEEQGRRAWLREGAMLVSDQRRGGTEAYAGERYDLLVVEWEPALLGGWSAPFEALTLGARALERLRALACALEGPAPEVALAEVFRVLRAEGLRITPPEEGALRHEALPEDLRLQQALSRSLSRLAAFPAIEDLSQELGWNQRMLHRRIAALAERYKVPWSHWRSALHHLRMVHALRLLAVPGATTELVARRAGFRAPSALCHAFAKAGLPSPGTLQRAALRGVLGGWSEFVELERAA